MKTIVIGALLIVGTIMTTIFLCQFFGLIFIICNNLFSNSHIPNTSEHRYQCCGKGLMIIILIACIIGICWLIGNVITSGGVIKLS